MEYSNGELDGIQYIKEQFSPQTYTLNSTNANSTTAHKLRISVTDAAGNIGTQLSDEFTIDNTAPTVTTLTNTTSIGANRYAKTGETITVNFTQLSLLASAFNNWWQNLTADPAVGFNATYTFTYLTDGSETEGLKHFLLQLQTVQEIQQHHPCRLNRWLASNYI